MIRLLSIKFVGIGRFVEPQEIDFTKHGNLIQVDGVNMNTGGSSGAGKSTVFHALDFLLGINEIPTTGLQSRGTKTTIDVEGVFDYNGKKVTIKRSKKNGLTIDIDGEQVIEKSSTIGEEKIDELIGIPRKLFKKMFHKRQKEGGVFTNLGPKDTHELFIKILGLEVHTDKIAHISNKIKDLDSSIFQKTTQKSSLEGIIQSLTNNLNSLVFPLEPIVEDVEPLKQTLHLSDIKLSEAKKSLQEELDSIPRPEKKQAVFDDTILLSLRKTLNEKNKEKQDFISSLSKERQEIERKITEYQSILNKISIETASLLKIGEELRQIKTQKTSIESSICPTCNQGWVGENAQNTIKTLTDRFNELSALGGQKFEFIQQKKDIEDKVLYLKEELSRIYSKTQDTGFDSQILSINQLISDETSRLNQIKTIIDNENRSNELEFNQKQLEINRKWQQNISIYSEQINQIKNRISHRNTVMDSYHRELSSFQKNTESTKRSLIEYNQSLLKLDDEIRALKKNKLIAEESIRLIKSYTLKIFQDSLDYIGALATQNLSKIPNMANASVYIESCKETKSGSIKDEINTIINLDGENEINIKTLSGGERTAIDLAIDLALIDMIEGKVGKGIDLFILDEPFNGLDHICIEQCLELLKQIDGNKKIIIVDHSSEVKSAVCDIIRVVRDGEVSCVK